MRDVYLTDDAKVAAVLLDKAIIGCRSDDVEEIRSLGDTLKRWRTEILNHHRTGASNGPTEGLNFCVKQVKRAGRGFTCFEHYRLRVLLHTGGVTWPRQPSPPRSEPALPTQTRRATLMSHSSRGQALIESRVFEMVARAEGRRIAGKSAPKDDRTGESQTLSSGISARGK